MSSGNYCNNEQENAVLYWNSDILGEDELIHKNTRNYTCLCEDCRYKLEGEEDE